MNISELEQTARTAYTDRWDYEPDDKALLVTVGFNTKMTIDDVFMNVYIDGKPFRGQYSGALGVATGVFREYVFLVHEIEIPDGKEVTYNLTFNSGSMKAHSNDNVLNESNAGE